MRFTENFTDALIGVGCAIALVIATIVGLSGYSLLLLTLVCFLFQSQIFGHRLAPHQPGFLVFLTGCISLLSLHGILQTAIYYLDGKLSIENGLLSLAASIATTAIFVGVYKHQDVDIEYSPTQTVDTNKWDIVWCAFLMSVACVSAVFLLRGAYINGTDQAIRTPWPLMPAGSFGAFALIALSVWISAWKRLPTWVTACLSIISIIPLTCIAALLYQNGFGFDGFLHRASEIVISRDGTLYPKPFYYIGQYAFVAWICRLFDITVHSVDTWLVPVASCFIPIFLLTISWGQRRAAWILAAASICIPFSAFVATTPQSFAYLLGFIALILAAAETNPLASLLVSSWSVAVHPLAGLPFFFGSLLLRWGVWRQAHGKKTIATPIPWILAFAAAASVPCAFILNSFLSSAKIIWNIPSLLHWNTYSDVILSFFSMPFSHAALWADWSALVCAMLPVVLIALSVCGALCSERRRCLWFWCIVLSVSMTIAAVVLRASGEFAFLIDYERGNYAERLFLIAMLFLSLPAIEGFAWFAKRILHSQVSGAVTLLVFLAALHAANAYNLLPRHDAAQTSRGWSVGRADHEAVRWINRDAGTKPYAVLANQSVSAAAVEAFGFKRYVGDVFYYPIPTGGHLYQLFLKTAYGQPTKDTIEQAGALTKSDIVYVAINDYWWDFDRITDRLKQIADETNAMADGKIIVFRFNLDNDQSINAP